MTDIIENLCQATDILVEKKLKSLAFDITIEATVTDTKNASDGRYIVSNGNTSFEAYSNIETNYNVNDIVLVNIPQGDYDNQKNIISKKADNVETSMTFKSPFENFIDISNNLISGQHYISMQANGKDQYSWDVNTPSFIDSQAFKIIKNLNNDRNNNRITKEEFQTKLKTETCLIWNSETDYNGKLFESKYTKLGIKMQVSTWLSEYDTVSGNFGLMVVLMLQANNSEDSFPVFIPFDSDEFFGNVYNFETYYSQELLVDISEYINFPIKQILLFAYQRDNFKNVLGEKIETKSNQEGFYSNSLPENIFIKDPYLCLGRTRDDFEEDSIEIITKSPKEYDTDLKGLSAAERLYNNKKVLGLRWIHKDLNTNEIKKVLTNEIPQDYHIYWYRYKIGAPSPDQFVGPNWERFYGAKNPFTTDAEGKIIQSFINDKEEYNLTSLDIKNGNERDIATDLIDNIIFYPNINRQTEQIKAIIVKEENNLNVFSNNQEEKIKRLICSSEIELFENNSEVRNEITFIDTNALSIRFNDEEKGNYFLYNRAGLVSKEKDKEVKTLTAVFDNSGEQNDVYQKKELEPPYTSIKWSFPASQTMIIPATNKNESAEKLTLDNLDTAKTNYEADEVTYNEIEDTYDFKFFIMNANGTKKSKEASLLSSIGYFINPKLSREANRNTVYLEINKDGQIYTASVKMNFGTAGTSGSDYTLTILWDNNDNAFDISKGVLSGQVYIYDQSGQKIELEEESSYSFEWFKVRAVNNNTQEREFLPKKETKDLYYPIANNAIKSLLWNGENYCKLTEPEHQKNNIKYLVDNENSNLQTFYYNVKDKAFKQVDINNNNNNDYILYRKLDSSSNESRGILNFKAFDEVQFDSNKSGQMEKADKGKMIYYYDSIRRAFIKYNDCFIIDPWNEYSSTETYYYPVYSSEQNYQSDENLQIIDYNKEENKQKGHFSIQTTENTKLNIETDLYILEVRLTHFGDYDLIARFPIPLKNGDSNHNVVDSFKSYIIDYIEGPTEVRYSTSGERDFNKNPYQIVFRYLTRHPIETYQKAIEKYKEQVEALFEKYQNEDNFNSTQFKEELTEIKNSVENLVLLTQDPKSEYTKILLNIEKIKFQQLMDEYNNLQNSSITLSNLMNKYNEYKNNIDKIEQEYETSINNFKSSPRYTLLYENLNDLLENSNQSIEEVQNNYDKTTFITYQQKRQGYKETELNVDEIVGHWELVREENNDFTFLNESNDIDFKDFIDFQLTGKNGTEDEDQPEEYSLYGLKDILENINNKLENNINNLEDLKESINDKISSYGYNIRYIEKVCDKEIGQIEEKIRKTNNEKTKIKLEKKIQLKIEKRDKKIQNLRDKIDFYEEKINELNELQSYQESDIEIFQDENSIFLDKINQEITRLEKLKDQHYFIKPYLNPSEIYFKDELIYGIKFVLDENILSYLDENLAQLQRYEIDPDSGQYIIIPRGTTLWSQPIYVYQDNYPSTTLNKWNGKGITTDEDTGIISANGFSAGKKENDNTFTGVVLGDWSRTDSDVMLTKQTGVFGFNHGAMSYALKDDGTAFFGKDGKGRIYFNGNKAQIYSANWISSIPKENDLGKYIQAKQGMMLDIDDGQLLINGLDQQKIIIAENGVSFSCLSSYNDSQINLLKLEFNSPIFENSNSKKRPSFYLQSVDYHKAKRYSVTIDNEKKSYYAPGGGIKFDLSKGEIDAYKLTLQVGQKLTYKSTEFLSYFLTINTNQDDFFKINNGAFIINKTGKVTCKKQFIVKSEVKKGNTWDKNRITNNIRITKDGALTTKDSITSWGNLIVKSNVIGGKNWNKNKITNNIRITKDGNLTTKKNLKCWGDLYLYFNGNNSGFKKGLHKIKLKNINGNMVLVASKEIY